MVPSRSMKTAGCKARSSSTLCLDLEQPRFRSSLDHLRGDFHHATMVGRATAEKAGTAVRFFLNDITAWSHGSSTVWIGGAKHGDHRQTDGGSDVHRSGIVADEEMTLGEQSRQFGDGRFPGEVDGRLTHFGSDGV